MKEIRVASLISPEPSRGKKWGRSGRMKEGRKGKREGG